jgi:catechol 2,3-dioxygenase-like lactoylglutathione lyase family enzyme
MNDESQIPESPESIGQRDILGQPTGADAPQSPNAEPQPESQTVAEPRELRIKGLHHITCICSNLDQTVAFYRDLLGMTLLKQSANDDDPTARHFYFGDPEASPGSMVTFLEYANMEQGQVGVGIVHHFALRAGSLDELEAWHQHLKAHGVQSTEPINRTYFSSIYFRDPDGNIVEIATDGPGLIVD